ncbi:unnamed protein product [Allacma fusca]|uniref:Uncharacterized protein n=1 Tax=Allacma fusca TaxID=39272 RepID=A0A8J2J9E6_9HEXA|nr:unnamed protein product [Allacma fusca]
MSFSNSYCANYCNPSPGHGCCFSSCCRSNAPCNEYSHICWPGGCPCPSIRPLICKCCCPPPPKVPRPCPCVPKLACGCGCLPS